MDQIMEVVEGAIANLAPGQNPWTLVHETLIAQVRPRLSHSFLSQLYATSAFLAINTIFLILSIIVKWRQGSFWIFKTFRGTGGNYLVVHYSSAFSTFMLVFFALLQPYIWKTVHFSEGHIVYDSALWRTLVWIPGVIAFFLATWSLCVSHILHKDSSGRPARTFFAQAWFVNCAGSFSIVGLIVSVAILAWQTQKHWHSAMQKFQALEDILTRYESTYNGTLDPTAFGDGTTMTVATGFATNLADFGTFFRWVFIAYLIWSVILLGTLVTSASLHLRELSRTMNDLGQRSVNEENKAQGEALQQSFTGLLYVTVGIIVSCVAICILFAFVAIAGRKVVYDATISKVASLLPVWLFAIFGFVLSLSFLIRLIRTSSAPVRAFRKTRTLSEETLPNVVHVPAGGNHGVLETLSPTESKIPLGEQYPLETLGHSAPGSVDDGSRRLSPSTLSQMSGSEAHLVQHAAMVEQPFYNSYASRPPSFSPEETLAPSKKKGWRG
ncbi:hypothetical protein JCM6882_003810 [Rhodosporidiobolus microsporus]